MQNCRRHNRLSNEINAHIIISRIRYARLQMHRDATRSRINTLSQSQRLLDIRQSREGTRGTVVSSPSECDFNDKFFDKSGIFLSEHLHKMLIRLHQIKNVSIVYLIKIAIFAKRIYWIILALLFTLATAVSTVINQSEQKRITIIRIDCTNRV